MLVLLTTKIKDIFLQWENTVRRKCEHGFFQITNAKKSRVFDSWFDKILAWVMCKNPSSQFQSHSIHIVENCKYTHIEKKLVKQQQSDGIFHVHTFKRWVKLVFTLVDNLTKETSLENLSNCYKAWTWVLLIFLICEHDFLFHS